MYFCIAIVIVLSNVYHIAIAILLNSMYYIALYNEDDDGV